MYILNIVIVSVGKIKENFISQGINEYLKRLKAYTNVSIIELKEETGIKNIELTIMKESQEIIKTLEKIGGYNILLDIHGSLPSSEEFSKEINTLFVKGNSTITFVIGGSYGVSRELKTYANMKLSFSRFTFPHQLMRLILIEQIYRAFNILNNGKYHK